MAKKRKPSDAALNYTTADGGNDPPILRKGENHGKFGGAPINDLYTGASVWVPQRAGKMLQHLGEPVNSSASSGAAWAGVRQSQVRALLSARKAVSPHHSWRDNQDGRRIPAQRRLGVRNRLRGVRRGRGGQTKSLFAVPRDALAPFPYRTGSPSMCHLDARRDFVHTERRSKTGVTYALA
jgi:hypothetical protein